jgi:hypothetical protein
MADQKLVTKTKSNKRGILLLDYTLLVILLSTSVFLVVLGIIFVFSNWVLTTGTVTFGQKPSCIPLENTTNVYDCSFTVRYKVVNNDGKLQFYFVKVDHVIGPRVRSGDVVYLQYDPKDPSNVVYGNTSYKTYGLLYLSFGALLSLLTIYYWNSIKKSSLKKI